MSNIANVTNENRLHMLEKYPDRLPFNLLPNAADQRHGHGHKHGHGHAHEHEPADEKGPGSRRRVSWRTVALVLLLAVVAMRSMFGVWLILEP
jgi:ABC-type nickel/cobalt efflux system permease component RcnA